LAAPLAAKLVGKLLLKTMFLCVGGWVIVWSLRILFSQYLDKWKSFFLDKLKKAVDRPIPGDGLRLVSEQFAGHTGSPLHSGWRTK